MGEISAWAYAVFKKSQEENSQYYEMTNTQERSAAFVGVATYSWKKRYSITGTYRYEGTNRMGKSRSARWLPTWNVSGAWNVHEESCLKNLVQHCQILRLNYLIRLRRIEVLLL